MISLVFFFFYHVLITSADHYLSGDIAIDCGSTGISTAFSGREWIGDIKSKSTTSPQIKGSSTSSSVVHNLVSTDPVPYKTARISRTQFSYIFRLSAGHKFIRFHFSHGSYRSFKKSMDFFTVQAGPYTLLSNFSASITADALGVKSFVKEYCINIGENRTLDIIFSPEHSLSYKTYAFINGIEVISMPPDLYYSHVGDLGAQVVGQKSRIYIDNSTALEVMHRLNIIWNTIPLVDNFGIFRMWGTVSNKKVNKVNNFTWNIPVDVGYGYLVRLHLCEKGLQMAETGHLVFRVFINDMIVETNVDKWKVGNDILWYRDYIVMVKGRKNEGRRDILIVLQIKDALKGLEILKLSNQENSLASPNPLPPARSPSSVTLQNFLSILGHGNTIATVAVIIIVQEYVKEITSADGVWPCSGETVQSISTEIQEMSSVEEKDITPPLAERNKCEMLQNAELLGRGSPVDKRKTNAFKLSRFWPWDAFWNRVKASKKIELDPFSILEYFEENVDLHRFDWETIAAATNKFSRSNNIGIGGFGSVYKVVLSTGQEVAVKKFPSNSRQGLAKLKNEVLLISKLQHPNLIKLLGYCFHQEESVIVYEFMGNKSLDAHIFDEARRHELGWTIRLKIIIGISRCLLEHMAICLQNISCTVYSVFSFGVVVLEILSGTRSYRTFPVGKLVEHAWKMWNKGKALELLDKSIGMSFQQIKH
ncbi:unnamed protein product [Fraxinus pennsylvanica]|uniref:Protein kinase domain-containing protein n=1 Tax=Fraxinus pennsylvanica TaxID=56036 RepID=A0AAD2DI87_9LAMI|nr:unnamed protein product [Fraxinus pennsylvanica]